MSRDQLRQAARARVELKARQRLARELDRAMASGLTERDVREQTAIVTGLRRPEAVNDV